MSAVTLCGIPNCDQVKKARLWLTQHDQAFVFHDFKKDGISATMIERWLQRVTWQQLINRKGTTWRALDAQRQAAIASEIAAIQLMCEQPSIIKRPVLVTETDTLVGFSDDVYQQIFKKTA